MRDLLARLRLMREKAYVNMLLFSGEFEPLEAEGATFLIQDMRNHLGDPQSTIFSVISVAQQVLDVFAENVEQSAIQITFTNQMPGDTLESDRLIVAIVLANVLGRSIARLSKGGQLHLTFTRGRRTLKIHLADDGYIPKDPEFFETFLRHTFFFLKADVLENVCASIGAKIDTKNRGKNDVKSLNSLTLQIPVKLKTLAQEEESIPENVIRFPKKSKPQGGVS